MIAKELITEGIIPLTPFNTYDDALKLMDEYKVEHLPIINGGDFLGILAETNIFSNKDVSSVLGSQILPSSNQYVYENQHFYDILIRTSEGNLTLIPVLDINNQYLGVITLRDLISKYTETSSIKNQGGIIILEMNINDYSLVEIAGIIETNGAKILNMYVSPHGDSTKMELSIKINKTDVAPILQTFERYNYNVLASFGESEINDNIKERYESLMNYLNI